MFDVVYGLKSIGTTETFLDAWEMIYEKAQKETPTTFQFLETMIWIEDKTTEVVYFFYDARDKAYKLGWQLPNNKKESDEKQTTEKAGSGCSS